MFGLFRKEEEDSILVESPVTISNRVCRRKEYLPEILLLTQVVEYYIEKKKEEGESYLLYDNIIAPKLGQTFTIPSTVLYKEVTKLLKSKGYNAKYSYSHGLIVITIRWKAEKVAECLAEKG